MPHYVYFIEGAGLVKIGYTNHVQYRLAGFQIGSPVPLTLLKTLETKSASAAAALEKHLHQKFSTYHRHGEWFEFSDEIRSFLDNPTDSHDPATPYWGFNGQTLLDIIKASPDKEFTRKELALLLGRNQLTPNEIESLKKLGKAGHIKIFRAEGVKGLVWLYTAANQIQI